MSPDSGDKNTEVGFNQASEVHGWISWWLLCNTSIILLAIGSALGLALVESIYVAKLVISPMYLGDAFVELVWIAGWVLSIVFS